jgi:anti-sigma-K factor RskA
VTGHATRREDVAGYLLGSLSPAERPAFEAHLAECASCREQMRELSVPAELLAQAVPAYDVPPGLEARTLSAIEASAAANHPRIGGQSLHRRLWSRPLALAAAAAALVAGTFVAATQLDLSAGGEQVELEAVLAPPEGGPARATVVVAKTEIGRVVSFSSDDLPILPKGEYYELWFVGPGGHARPPQPNLGRYVPSGRAGPLARRADRGRGPSPLSGPERHRGAGRRKPAADRARSAPVRVRVAPGAT